MPTGRAKNLPPKGEGFMPSASEGRSWLAPEGRELHDGAAGLVGQKEENMADNKKKVGKADRIRVAGGEKYEIAYAAKKAGVSPAKVRAAVKATGPMRKAVMKKLDARKYGRKSKSS